jgi:signal transduction histidine kinase
LTDERARLEAELKRLQLRAEVATREANAARTSLATARADAGDVHRRFDAYQTGLAAAIRGPISTLSMALELLGSPTLDDRSRARAVRTCKPALGALERLLEATSGPIRASVERRVHLGSWLEQLVAQQAPPPGVRVEVDARRAPSHVALQDRDTARIVQELLANALAAATNRVTLHAEAVTQGIRIRIADDGAGLDPTLATGALFERMDGREIGLGLAIAQRCADRIGAVLRLRNQGGTEWQLLLPMEASTAPAVDRVAVVFDREVSLTADTLRGSRVRVRIARSAADAVVEVASNPPDVAVVVTETMEAAWLLHVLVRLAAPTLVIGVGGALPAMDGVTWVRDATQAADVVRRHRREPRPPVQIDHELRDAFRASLPARATELNAAGPDLRHRRIRSLVGTAASYGFPSLTLLGRAWLLLGERPDADQDRERAFQRLLTELQTSV